MLRDAYGVLPPGDLRRCLIALSDESEILRDVFSYRFEEPPLAGHNLGNLFFLALTKTSGSERKAIESIVRILKIKGRVPRSQGNGKSRRSPTPRRFSPQAPDQPLRHTTGQAGRTGHPSDTQPRRRGDLAQRHHGRRFPGTTRSRANGSSVDRFVGDAVEDAGVSLLRGWERMVARLWGQAS